MTSILELIFIVGWTGNTYFAVTGLIEYTCRYNYWVEHGYKKPTLSFLTILSIIVVVAPLAKMVWDVTQ